MNTKTATKAKRVSGALGLVDKVVDQAFDLVIGALSTDAGSAIGLLVRQHTLVKALFKKLEGASTRVEKAKLFEEVAKNLVAHDAIEREIFYPACERTMGMTDLLGEALVEHGVIEFCLYEADQARRDEDFAFKCQVLSEMVLHHVKDEEHEFFPRVEKALGKQELARLGVRMQERFEAAKAQDFRTAVYDNLKQVLAGALEPGKRTAKSAKKRARKSEPPKSAKKQAPRSKASKSKPPKRRRAA